MKLYQALLKNNLRAADGDSVEYHIQQYAQTDLRGIDSLRFITTAKFLFKFEMFLRDELNMKLAETAFHTNHLTLADYFSFNAPKKARELKIGARANIYAYHTSNTISEARDAHRAKNHFFALELHGLSQYYHNGEAIELDDKAQKIIKYLLRHCAPDKTRAALRLASFDYALDYREKVEPSREYAILKAPYVELMEAEFKKKETTLYIQRGYRRKGIVAPLAGNLQRVTIYDKTKKNKLASPLMRFELCFFLARQ